MQLHETTCSLAFRILVSTVDDLQALANACLYQSCTEIIAVLVVTLQSTILSFCLQCRCFFS